MALVLTIVVAFIVLGIIGFLFEVSPWLGLVAVVSVLLAFCGV
jgi:hypothetical protein